MTYQSFHLSGLSYSPPYGFQPVEFNPTFASQPSQFDFDDGDDPLSPAPSADDHYTQADANAAGSSKSKSGGRKKAANPNSQAARRDQNRIAQREFRLRKQQRIRDLEARVEILSEGQDEAYAQLRDVIRDLMDENTTLRGLLRDVTGFIGEGIGGTLKPRTGWDPAKFREFCERGETDTAYEGWVARKRARGIVSDSLPPGSEHADEDEHDEGASARKRRRSTRKDSELTRPFGPSPTAGAGPSDEGKISSCDSLPRSHLDGLDIDWSNTGLRIPQSNPNARSRKDLDRPLSAKSNVNTHAGPFPDTFSSTFAGASGAYSIPDQRRHSPSSFPTISPQMSSTRTRVRPGVDAHADIVPPLPSASTLGPPPPLDVSVGVGVGVNVGQGATNSLFQPGYGVSQPQLTTYGTSRPMSAAPQSSMYYTMHPGGAGAEPQQIMNAGGVGDDFGEADPQLREAGALIKYHIDNYRRNENYHLPPSLRPTLTQRTVQHNGVIDGLIFPTMRDRAILLSGRFDFAECFADMMRAVVIHGDDVLAHSNWEISLSWMKRYHFLVDESILSDSTNPWRRKRGDRELSMADIQPSSTEYTDPSK